MATEGIRLIRRIHRSANAVEVRALGGGHGAGSDDAFQQQLTELHRSAVSDLASDHPLPKRVVIDLRQVEVLSSRMLGDLVRLHRFLRAVQTELVLVAEPGVRESVQTAKLDKPLIVLTNDAELKRGYGIELAAANGSLADDEAVSFTEAELREMEAAGLTLGNAIRAIEAEGRPG